MGEADRIPSSELTPPSTYFGRRAFIGLGVAAASAAVGSTRYITCSLDSSCAATPSQSRRTVELEGVHLGAFFINHTGGGFASTIEVPERRCS